MRCLSERDIERWLIKAVRDLGGACPKLVCPGMDGMPDRLVLLPHGRIAFAEVKSPGKRPRPLQASRHRLLKSLGFRVYVIDAPEQIGGILDEIRTA